MPDVDTTALSQQVLLAAFVIACGLGALLQKTHFCTMGALADIFSFGSWVRMRMWWLAIATAIIGTHAMAAAGLIDLRASFYTQARVPWLSHLTGGLLFGLGMVFASGCGGKTLIRAGSGNLKAWVVLLTMAIASGLTLKGLFAPWRVYGLDRFFFEIPGGQAISQIITNHTTLPVSSVTLAVGLGVGALLLALCFAHPDFRSDRRAIIGGLGVGLLVTALWYVSGHLGFVAEDPDTLEARYLATASARMESFSFVGPIANALELLWFWTDTSRRVTIGVITVAGVMAGSFITTLLSRNWRWEGFRDASDLAHHLLGAILMGIGGVTAVGCTIGQGLSGVSTLAIGSFITLLGITAGAWLGLRWQLWRLEHT